MLNTFAEFNAMKPVYERNNRQKDMKALRFVNHFFSFVFSDSML
jgi:hypothetical protein